MSQVLDLVPRRGFRAGASLLPSHVYFERAELNRILSVYSRKVIAGEWCDYAIDTGETEAVFSIFGRRAGFAAFRVVKHRERGDRRYRVVATGGRILKVSPTIEGVLPALEKKRLRAL